MGIVSVTLVVNVCGIAISVVPRILSAVQGNQMLAYSLQKKQKEENKAQGADDWYAGTLFF